MIEAAGHKLMWVCSSEDRSTLLGDALSLVDRTTSSLPLLPLPPTALGTALVSGVCINVGSIGHVTFPKAVALLGVLRRTLSSLSWAYDSCQCCIAHLFLRRSMQLSAVAMVEELVCGQVPHLRQSNLVTFAVAPVSRHVECATDMPVAFYSK